MNLPDIDLAILVAYLVAMVAFGVWIGRRQKGAADFMVSGRDLPWWLVLFSIVATETSTATFLSIPGVAFAGDLTWLQIPIGFCVGRFAVLVLLLPRYFRGELFTAYQVLDERFGGATKRLASGLFLVTRTLADGLRLFLAAIVLQEVAGIPMNHAIVALGIATVLYTFVGGIRAVVWTDFVQFVVYMVGAIVAFAVLIDHVDGGFAGLIEAADAAGKLRMFDFTLAFDRHALFWAGLIGGAVLALGSHGVDQLMVQRYLSARSQRHAAIALGWSGVIVWFQFAFFMLIGLGLWAYYRQTSTLPDGIQNDQVFATFITTPGMLPRGVLGIVLGAVFAAAMSTLSSSLNSSATALLEDIWRPLVRPAASDRERLATLRVFTIVFGLLQISVGIAGQFIGRSVVNSVLAIAGLTTGLILGVFVLGIAARRARSTDAFVGLSAGAVTMAFVYFGTPIAWPWYALIGSATVLVTGTVASTFHAAPPR